MERVKNKAKNKFKFIAVKDTMLIQLSKSINKKYKTGSVGI